MPMGCGLDNQRGRGNEVDPPPVDTFYVHPTSFMDPTSTKWNAPLTDFVANVLTDAGQLQQQASAFNGASRVFAPRYRQCSMWSQSTEKRWNTWPNNPWNGTTLQLAMDIAFSDIASAFDHFLDTTGFNDARPIVLAGHSQGTMQLKRLIDLIDTEAKYAPVKERIVVAYLIGNTVEEGEMPSWLPMSVFSFTKLTAREYSQDFLFADVHLAQ